MFGNTRIEFIDLDTFLFLFDNTKKMPTYSEWKRNAKITFSNGRIEPLTVYFKNGRLDDDSGRFLYELIVKNKNQYLEAFYKKSLAFEQPITISEQPMKNEYSNNRSPKYKNIIRNMFYREVLYDTESGLGGLPTYLRVVLDLFRENIIDYKLLTPSGLDLIMKGSLSSILSGFYFRASIMNPYLVYSLNQTLLKGKRVFTPTLGWCSYMYGFAESGVREYVGIDVIPHVCDVARDFARDFYPNLETNIYCKPSEDFLADRSFLKRYAGHFDTIFFSPPYYELELYKGGEQSTDRYKTYEEWLEGYWHNTIRLCDLVAKRGARLCYIVSEYGKYDDMVRDMNAIAAKYFKLVDVKTMGNKNVDVTKHRNTGEKINIFIKQ